MFFGNTYLKKIKGKPSRPKLLVTQSAQRTVKVAAKITRPSLYAEIKDINLIAKEFKYHDKCYKEFTRNVKTVSQQETCESNTTAYSTGNCDAVKEYVNTKVITESQAVSMKTLHEIYGLNVTDVRYRGKLKSRIENEYKDRILFLQTQKNIPLVLVSANISLSEINFTNNKECIVKSAEYLREDIIQYSENLPELSWPPTSNELSSDERSTIPASLLTFLNHLLKSSDKHAITRSSNAVRLVNSYASDMIHGVTRGEVITAKHFLLALGLHSITGQKKPIQICNRLGHCISYDLAMDIETAQVQKAQLLAETSGSLPLKPITMTWYLPIIGLIILTLLLKNKQVVVLLTRHI